MGFAIGPHARRVGPGDALRDQSTRAGVARGCNEVASSFLADVCVAGEGAGSLRRIVNRSQIRQLVNDNLRLRLKDRRRQRFRVEHVDQEWARAELAKEFAVIRRTR